MPQDPEDLLADWQWRVQRQTEATHDLSRRMQQVSGSAESRDGDVVVTVDHAGGLSSLTLTDEAMRLAPQELAQLIMATSRRAQARLSEEMGELVKGMFGSDSDTTSFITGTYADQFPAQPSDPREERDW
ncbi:YbaB/EbfC family nucleoid-associated protein [Actinoplanes sp. NPDC049802]|uniref:YbaB/EbfC family nucleoid-associated protein n=1 Tax=Actinoplanes sp. NPDC049802 TaxID=3154742 RepID=UPI0033C5C416